MCLRRAIPGAPQRKAQLLPLPNGRQVRAEALKQDVLIGGDPGLDNFLDGHDHPTSRFVVI